MTRNSSSTQSLRDTLADLTLSTSPSPQLQGQKLESPSRPAVQITGQDIHPKSLFNLITSDEATREERTEFNSDMHQLQAKPASQSDEMAELRGEEKCRDSERRVSKARADIVAACRMRGPDADTARFASSRSLQEAYEALATIEHVVGDSTSGTVGYRNYVGDCTPGSMPTLTMRQHVLLGDEKQKLHFGLRDSTWEREHQPLLLKPKTHCTSEEFGKIDQLWKAYVSGKASERWRRRSQANVTAEVEAEENDAKLFPQVTSSSAAHYTKPFCEWLTENPTVFHAVASLKQQLMQRGWTELNEREVWDIEPSGTYFVERNGSSLIAFVVGAKYEVGNGAAIIAGHVDALTAKLKPVSQVPNKAGYLQLGVAPYAGALNSTWWDRDLGIGGRVLIKEGNKIVTKLVKLNWPIAKIPTLAPHFGAPSQGPFNLETQMVPIIGLENTTSSFTPVEPFSTPSILGGLGSFTSTQPPRLVKAIGDELGLKVDTYSTIVNWELELFDIQPATLAGLDKEFISAGRIDDKLCSWSALTALMDSNSYATRQSSIIKAVGLFDDEEIGSLLRQGAHSNFLPSTIERAVGSIAGHHPGSDLMGRTYANSFLVSSDVNHAVNPNFLGVYLENHAPQLNVGVAVSADSKGHMTTDAASMAIFQRCAEMTGSKLQVSQPRNDSRSGGTIGPMLSAMTGIRAIDAGMPQLSMHSIRATTGALDPGLGVIMFTGFLNGYESADREMR